MVLGQSNSSGYTPAKSKRCSLWSLWTPIGASIDSATLGTADSENTSTPSESGHAKNDDGTDGCSVYGFCFETSPLTRGSAPKSETDRVSPITTDSTSTDVQNVQIESGNIAEEDGSDGIDSMNVDDSPTTPAPICGSPPISEEGGLDGIDVDNGPTTPTRVGIIEQIRSSTRKYFGGFAQHSIVDDQLANQFHMSVPSPCGGNVNYLDSTQSVDDQDIDESPKKRLFQSASIPDSTSDETEGSLEPKSKKRKLSDSEAFRTPKNRNEPKKLRWANGTPNEERNEAPNEGPNEAPNEEPNEAPNEEPSEEASYRKKRREDLRWLKRFGVEMKFDIKAACRRVVALCKDELFRNRLFPTIESDGEESDAVLKSLQEFVKQLSVGVKKGGTRTKEQQEAVVSVLLAAIYNNPRAIDHNWLAKKFKISRDFAKKIFRMKEEGKLKEERKRRRDAISKIVAPYIWDFCHDDDYGRPDTSVGGRGDTSRGFINGKDRNGDKDPDPHYYRIWSCATWLEKSAIFEGTMHYHAARNALLEKIPRLDPAIKAAELMLRERLGTNDEKRFTRNMLKEVIKEKRGEFKKNDEYHVLVQNAFQLVFGYGVDSIEEEKIEEAKQIPLIDLQMFSELCCKCVRNPDVKSCVDPIYSQMEAYMKSLEKAINHNPAIKALFANCHCQNCKAFRDPERIKGEGNYQLRDLLSGSTQQLLARTCCPRKDFPSFRNPLDLEDPGLVPFECIKEEDNVPVCSLCGVEKKLNDPFHVLFGSLVISRFKH